MTQSYDLVREGAALVDRDGEGVRFLTTLSAA